MSNLSKQTGPPASGGTGTWRSKFSFLFGGQFSTSSLLPSAPVSPCMHYSRSHHIKTCSSLYVTSQLIIDSKSQPPPPNNTGAQSAATGSGGGGGQTVPPFQPNTSPQPTAQTAIAVTTAHPNTTNASANANASAAPITTTAQPTTTGTGAGGGGGGGGGVTNVPRAYVPSFPMGFGGVIPRPKPLPPYVLNC